MYKVCVALLLALFLPMCIDQPATQDPDPIIYDQCVRAELFQKCLERIPKGPERITAAGNDWDEVVVQCNHAATYQSSRRRSAVDPKCASH